MVDLKGISGEASGCLGSVDKQNKKKQQPEAASSALRKEDGS